ncbi:MAG TPA: YidC/Oxa1 family membrane protein insertase [Candidatus Saccharimonadales bacterium]|nr:YidC/Oxa1 family membrane protein insertase [Candidatus Saccharimonadales bacterium]
MQIFVNLLLALTNLFGGSLGLTIIFIGVVSRLAFYPFLKTSLNQTKVLKELKPKLDEIKRKYPKDRTKAAEEQSKLYREAGFNPLASCLSPVIQLVIAIILFNALTKLIHTPSVDTTFLWWDLAKPNVFHLQGIPIAIPGILVILTGVATLIQSKMMLPEPLVEEKSDSKTEVKEKADLSEALNSSQGQLVYLLPLIIIWSGTRFPAGLALYWLVSTLVGIIQQYQIAGPGGLKSWLYLIRRS